MESQDKEREYEHNIWEIYRKEWATASLEKKIELNKQMRRWQELMKDGVTASQAYYRVMEEDLKREVIEVVSPEPAHRSRWSWIFKATSAVLALAVIVAVIYGVVITEERNALNAELKAVQSVLVSTQADLSSTELTLASTQSEFNTTKQTLVSTQSELSSTEQTLASTQAQLSSMEQTLTSTQSELNSTEQILTSTQAELGSTQQQLAVAQETLGGLGITVSASSQCNDEDFITTGVGLIDNPTATNPTWSQLMAFISQDQTDKHTYTYGVYDCSLFSRDVHNNAEAAGIRAAEVQVKFRYESTGHALNAFLTTDYRLVYVDCTKTDTIARVKTGEEYRAVELYNITGTNVRNDYWWDALSSYYYILSSRFIGTVGCVTSSIEIYW